MPETKIPIDSRNEQVILGCALKFKDSLELFVAYSDWDDFLDPKHKIIAWCCATMYERDLEISDDSFNLVLQDFPDSQNRSYGGNTYLAKLKATCPVENPNLVEHLNKLKSDAVKNRVASGSLVDLYQQANNPLTSIGEIKSRLAEIQKELESGEKQEVHFCSSDEIAESYRRLIEERKKPGGTFVTSGFSDLDAVLTEGFAPGLVSIVAGMTGTAKSSLVDNFSLGQLVEGIKPSIVSLEMIKESHFDRLCSIMTNIPIKTLIKTPGDLSEEELALYMDAIAALERAKHSFQINDRAIVTLEDIDFQLTIMGRMGRKPDIVYIDLFGKLDDVSVEANLPQTIERQLRIARAIARKHEVHICCVVQIRRYFDQDKVSVNRKIPRPTLDKIKNSGAFAEEADLVLLLHRNKYYLPELDYDIVEVTVAKQRQGVMNQTIYFGFEDICTRFSPTSQKPHDL